MKIALKDYQEDAAKHILANLDNAAKIWRDRNVGDKNSGRSAFGLTALTGAGKTIIMASVIESLFEKERNAVVIWFSDSPSLNEQSRFRLIDALDLLRSTELRTVETSFNQAKFDPGTVYFLNTQKMNERGLLIRRTDKRCFSIWDTIENTINDPNMNIYLFIDEAHRGIGNNRDQATIAREMILGFDDGKNSFSGMPITLGISATIERFNRMVEGFRGAGNGGKRVDVEKFNKLSTVEVPPGKVRESGLVKDKIIIDNNQSETNIGLYITMVARATRMLHAITAEWDWYTDEQSESRISPLMILQVENNPDHDKIGDMLKIIFDNYPDLNTGSVVNVFGKHEKQKFGEYEIEYKSPEDIQDEKSIRVVIAKDAISTGWDCPRAEVLISFRPATDFTYVSQMLGRMIRSPLARRIEGNDALNSVECILPNFDADAVNEFVRHLGENDYDGFAQEIIVNPTEYKIDPDIPKDVHAKIESLPSSSLSRITSNPIRRLKLLSQKLAADDILHDAGKSADTFLHNTMDRLLNEHKKEIDDIIKRGFRFEGRTKEIDAVTKEMGESYNFTEVMEPDKLIHLYHEIKGNFITEDLAEGYCRHIAKTKFGKDNFHEGVERAREYLVAMRLHNGAALKWNIEKIAGRETDDWLDKYDDKINRLPHGRRDEYDQIRRSGGVPIQQKLKLPQSQKIRVEESDEYRSFPKHLYCDAKKVYTSKLNQTEADVLGKELARDDVVAWYRNPSSGYDVSLGIPYEHEQKKKIVRPDFILFTRLPDGSVGAEIIDPHGDHQADYLPKLKGLAEYAEKYGEYYRRIASFNHDATRVVDLMRSRMRKRIREWNVEDMGNPYDKIGGIY